MAVSIEAVARVAVLDQPASDEQRLFRRAENAQGTDPVRPEGATVLRCRGAVERHSQAGGNGPPERQLGEPTPLVDGERAIAGPNLRRTENRPLPARANARPCACRRRNGEREREGG